MSYAYDQYLRQHRDNVVKGFNWITEHVPKLLDGLDDSTYNILNHDQTKIMTDEYPAYDAYFYGGNRSAKVVNDFELAFLKHIHRNPHHWQYWVLLDDGKTEHTEKVFEMPYKYVLEMVCDWWSFSWSKGDRYSIFVWYDEHKDGIKLHPKTRKTVEDILETIKQTVNDQETKENTTK